MFLISFLIALGVWREIRLLFIRISTVNEKNQHKPVELDIVDSILHIRLSTDVFIKSKLDFDWFII